MRLFGFIFFIAGLPFFTIGLIWLQVTIDDTASVSFEMLIGPAVFSFMGFVFMTIGGGVLWMQRKQRLKRKMLMQTGRKLKAIITHITQNQNIKVNNRHPHIVICTAPISGIDKEFKSSNIYGSLRLNMGDELDVYIDFRNHDHYWVEIPEDATRR
ncbi:MAG: hypothetical protein RIF39_09970 [Cyclobacteriaceae bacterium]